MLMGLLALAFFGIPMAFLARFYAIYRADDQNENIPVLIDWLRSEEGQSLIARSGYVPMG